MGPIPPARLGAQLKDAAMNASSRAKCKKAESAFCARFLFGRAGFAKNRIPLFRPAL
jgi:hypothetical protein